MAKGRTKKDVFLKVFKLLSVVINHGRKIVKKSDEINFFHSKHPISYKPVLDGKKIRGKGKREEEDRVLAPDYLINCTCKGCPSIRRSEIRQT